jgi:hypothetical protein
METDTREENTMQTTQAMILDELARWGQAQKDLEAILSTAELTVNEHSRLKRVHELVAQEIAKYKAAIADYPNAN